MYGTTLSKIPARAGGLASGWAMCDEKCRSYSGPQDDVILEYNYWYHFSMVMAVTAADKTIDAARMAVTTGTQSWEVTRG